ncbi:MAG: nitrous oxide reductase accessory protein NosL [Phycisphaerales bacterium]
MRRLIPVVAAATSFALIAGCEEQSAEAPPTIRLGDSVCDQCNMIISDERWATATIIDGPRGPEPRLFDDFNCQVNHEVEHPDLEILARWSHSHATGEWVRTEDASFLMSPNLHTPMGSKVAAFASPSELEAARQELTGDTMTFDVAWKRLGFAGACCSADEAESSHPKQEHDDGP